MRSTVTLAEHVRDFRPTAARAKAQALAELEQLPRCSARKLLRLQGQLGFLLAYPDDAHVRRGAEAVSGQLRRWVRQLVDAGSGYALEDSGLPGAPSRRVYSYEVTRELMRLLPGEIDVDWELLEERAELHDTLGVLVLDAENPALDDIEIGTRTWLAGRAGPGRSGLDALLEVFERSSLAPNLRAALYETCAVPLRVDDRRGERGRTELRFPVARIHYQKRPIARESWRLAPRIRRPLPDPGRLTRAHARERLDRALLLMESRGLEIFPLTHAEPRDVRLITCGRGVEILLAGVRAPMRCAFESLYTYLVTKNGVGIAYGPASPFLGSCEMGINFFEEFRGAETRFIYTEVMRVLYHVLGVRNFYVTPYGMGKGNAAALATGAFWFYRKLGFETANPEVERLAADEEARMRGDRAYRSDRKTLRRLADTAAVLDLSGGACPRFDSSALALAVTHDLLRSGAGPRAEYEQRRARSLARKLGIRGLPAWTADEHASLRRMAPALCLIPDLARWSKRERDALTRIVRAKAATSEARAGELMLAHRRLVAGLRAVAGGGAVTRGPGVG